MSSSRTNEGLAVRLFPAGLAAVLVACGLYFDTLAVESASQEIAMNGKPRGKGPEAGHAEHGPQSLTAVAPAKPGL